MNTEKMKTLSEVDLREEEWINEILEFINKFIYCGGGIAHADVMDFARSIIYLANEKLCELEVHHMHAVSHEREECAKIAENIPDNYWIGDLTWEAKKRIADQIAAEIRARGKV